MTTINTIQDLLQLLRDQPQWAEELRGILLSKELQDLPAAVRELAQAVRDGTAATDQRLTALETDTAQLKADTTQLKADTTQLKADTTQLKTDTAQLKADTAHLKGDMGRLRGAEYERRAEDRAVHRTLTQLGFVQPWIIKGPRSGIQPLLSSVLARALIQADREGRTIPQPSEDASFLYADIIVADLGDPDEGDRSPDYRRQRRCHKGQGPGPDTGRHAGCPSYPRGAGRQRAGAGGHRGRRSRGPALHSA